MTWNATADEPVGEAVAKASAIPELPVSEVIAEMVMEAHPR